MHLVSDVRESDHILCKAVCKDYSPGPGLCLFFVGVRTRLFGRSSLSSLVYKGPANSVKTEMVNTPGFAARASVATTQVWGFSTEVLAVDVV